MEVFERVTRPEGVRMPDDDVVLCTNKRLAEGGAAEQIKHGTIDPGIARLGDD